MIKIEISLGGTTAVPRGFIHPEMKGPHGLLDPATWYWWTFMI